MEKLRWQRFRKLIASASSSLMLPCPEMDGVEFAARAHELRPEIPLLLLTGHDSMVDQIIARGSMALLKPYEPERLLGLVEEMLGRGH